jgi:hypothetical protein
MDIYVECPHCNHIVTINIKEINCGIFRHAVFKKDMKPINPHETEANCYILIRDDLVFGCTKPFKVIKLSDDKYITESCDYI